MTFRKEADRISFPTKNVTTLNLAKQQVPGFKAAFSRFEKRLILDQCSKRMFSNYGRNLAHLALHFGRVPHEVSVEEINAYLYRLTVHENLSISFFKQAVVGFWHWFRLFDMNEKALQIALKHLLRIKKGLLRICQQ